MSRRNLYSRAFFAHMRGGAAVSARALVPIILDIHRTRSVVDVGCGTGVWVNAFIERGVVGAIGIDGSYVDSKQLVIDEAHFIAQDLNRKLDTADLGGRFGDKETGRFDLAMSLEVAEHLVPARADSLVRDLCGLSDVVLFGAATPFQGGAGHVNERWQSWWAWKFATNGYDPFDVLRRDIWASPDIAWWYKQNTIFYVKQNSPAHGRFAARFGNCSGTMFDIVHPELFRGKVSRLKNGNVLQKLWNRFRLSGDEPRGKVLETPLRGDEDWQRPAGKELRG
jgi:SAM-dependent methyltransferase